MEPLKRSVSVVVLASGLLIASVAASFAAAGELDTSFGGDGKVVTDLTTKWDTVWGLAVQADGKIVAAGASSGSGGRYSLSRYAVDGSLDSTFSNDGKVLTNLTREDDWAFDVAIQSDGKIVVGGAAGGLGGRFGLLRYNEDGTLDPTFGGDGIVTTNFTAVWDVVTGVEIQPDGKIIAGGAANNDGNFAVARYHENGSLDTSFSGDGKVRTDITPGYDWAWDIALQADGKIVAGGGAGRLGGRFGLLRYNVDGTVDATFGGDGVVITNFTPEWDAASAVEIQADGKIVAGGAANDDRQYAVARYHPNGSLDASFSGDGKVATNITSRRDWAWDVALQADGRIVAGGAAGGSGGRFGLVRYLENGALDTSFHGDGKLTTDFTAGWDVIIAVTVQADGKLLVGGTAAGAGGRFALARYLAADAGFARVTLEPNLPAGGEEAAPRKPPTAGTRSHG